MKQSHSIHPAVLAICAAVTLASTPSHAAGGVDGQPQSVVETDRIIVKYRDAQPAAGAVAARAGAVDTGRRALLDRAGQQFGIVVQESHAISTGAQVFKLDRKRNVQEVGALAAEMMARDPAIEYAEPDRIMTHMATPTDPRYNEQWHYHDATGGLRLPAAWDRSTGSGVVVAVIDTGIRPHADLAGQVLPGYDFVSTAEIGNDGNGRDSDPSDPGDAIVAGACGSGQPARDIGSSWHGTHVAGTVAARSNNGVGVTGVAWNAKILPVRVLGKCGGYLSDIADAIAWASGASVSGAPANASKARVLNLSLGGAGSCDATTQNAINGARSRGAVVVVAAGNDGVNVSQASPANCAGVIAVAATGRSGGRAAYSNFGTLVDVAAPGGDGAWGVLSTLNSGLGAPAADSYGAYQGTSMATPHVAGVAALMLAANPKLTVDEVEQKLKSTARAFPASCAGCGTGIVDAAAAVAAVAGSSAPAVTLAESEPNNTTGTADPVASANTSVTGNLGSTTDSDYFRVELPAGRTLAAALTAGASNGDYDLYVLNGSGAQLGGSENGPGVVERVSSSNTGAAVATRYVRVAYYGGGTGATAGKYTLTLSW